MSTELERRLEGFLAGAPEPEADVGEQALARALRALRPGQHPHRRLRTAVLALVATLIVLVAAAGSLAAVGALHVSFSKTAKPPVARETLTLPAGADGIAVVVDGKLSLVTKSGFRLQGLPVSAAALSPHALYVAAGVGDSLVAMAPDGRRAWSRPAGGSVVAIAWAPDGFRIAYVVRTPARLVLHVIWGNGSHDEMVARGVRPVRPSWRADSLAVAYVGAGGRAVVYDLGHRSRRVVGGSPSDVTQLAYSPSASQLALSAAGRVGVAAAGRVQLLPRARTAVNGIGWLGRDLLAEAAGSDVTVESIGTLPAYRPLRLGGRVTALVANGRRLVAVVAGSSPRIVSGGIAHLRVVARLSPGATVGDISLG